MECSGWTGLRYGHGTEDPVLDLTCLQQSTQILLNIINGAISVDEESKPNRKTENHPEGLLGSLAMVLQETTINIRGLRKPTVVNKSYASHMMDLYMIKVKIFRACA